MSSRLRRNRQQTEERDEQLEKQLARLQLEQKSLAGSIVPMTASNWRLEQPKLKAALFLLQGGGVPEFIPILADEEYSVTTLGSGDRNTVRLWHRYVDDQHCLIRYENNKCFIRDGWQEQERSTNGTFVNHEPVGWEERKLEDGDQIQLGLSVRYSFRTKRSDDALLTEAPALEAAPTPAMMLTLADPPAATTQTQVGQNS
ncbi:MAG: FHA domain-containing protein [Caldilinea sp. CFX5]|nr:FHA domain-containing protein [Caldilinea sp. CFX5]